MPSLLKQRARNALVLLLPLFCFHQEALNPALADDRPRNIVVMRQDPANPKRENDTVCFPKSNQQIECGRVIKATTSELIVTFQLEGEGIKIVGGTPPKAEPPPIETRKPTRRSLRTERPKAAPLTTTPPPPPSPPPVKIESPPIAVPPHPSKRVSSVQKVRRPSAMTEIKSEAKPSQKKTMYEVGLGTMVGKDFFYPDLYFQFLLFSPLAVGLEFIYLNNLNSSPHIVGYGGALSLTYFPLEGTLPGLQIQAIASVIKMSSTLEGNTSSFSPIAVASLIGYKLTTPYHIHFTLGAGAQYVTNSRLDVIDYGGFLPVLKVEVGFGF